ncbi:phosphoenolpyruvate--protein phosphotransferase [Bartonella sp. DGB1]|uniref:phosphoenolpyruvate--protein phosphotransferase n=1 Tax=Bartonella sp. DGB1 TaxID=3239807 RepID=UPI0035251327
MLDNLVDPKAKALLTNLRLSLTENHHPQQRLNDIVEKIASFLNTDICSIYILQADDSLQLYATKGLNQEAVHKVRLVLGQGLIGTIAASNRILNLKHAPDHPNFYYVKETNEDDLSAFLGVPILRMGRCFGVLAIQSKEQKLYSDEELNALKTSAIVLSELMRAGELPFFEQSRFAYDLFQPLSLAGVSLNKGLAIGSVILQEPIIVIDKILNDNVEQELIRLQTALEETRLLINNMLNRIDIVNTEESKDILETYKMFAYDKGWINRIEASIQQGFSAEASVEKERNEIKARFQRIQTPYLKERFSDFEDLCNRLLRILMGKNTQIEAKNLPKGSILIARSLSAAQLLDYPNGHLTGLVLEDGSRHSHVTIVAKSLGIPVIGQIDNITELAANGNKIILDGDLGELHLRPSEELEQKYKIKDQLNQAKVLSYRQQKDTATITKDGVEIKLFLNAGLSVDLKHLEETGAAGIGLLRTELHFMMANHLPRLETQEQFYRSIINQAKGKPVIFRTLDVGSDKHLSYFPNKSLEQNPALGWRATRLALQRPALLRNQLRALLRASNEIDLHIMFPLISEVFELKALKALVDKELAYLNNFGYKTPKKLYLGSMIEVPSLLWQLDELFNAVDFVSIGSNDLFQFFVAADRCNKLLSDYFDPLSGSFLRCLLNIIQAGERHKKTVSLCGEMASDPLMAMALIGLGLKQFSVNAMNFGAVKNMLISLNAKQLQAEFIKIIQQPITTASSREWLEKFAKDNKVEL